MHKVQVVRILLLIAILGFLPLKGEELLKEEELSIEEELAIFIDDQSTQHLEQRYHVNEAIILMNYLKGSWDTEGYIQIPDFGGRRMLKASFKGTEEYKMDLDDHFLQRNVDLNLDFYSLKKKDHFKDQFSMMGMLAFATDSKKFFLWYFDSYGQNMQAEGGFQEKDRMYQFHTHFINEKGSEVEALLVMEPIDNDRYKWFRKEKRKNSWRWNLTASGLSTRKMILK